jgi:hypothetical protein
MAFLDELDRAVRNILSRERIGQPVFVRCAIHQDRGKNDSAILLTQLAGHARHWLNQDWDRVYANGQIEGGALTLALRCRQGASALLTYAEEPSGAARTDLMILGNHGAIHFDDLPEPCGGNEVLAAADPDHFTSDQNRFLDAVRLSLRSGQPESVIAEPPS